MWSFFVWLTSTGWPSVLNLENTYIHEPVSANGTPVFK